MQLDTASPDTLPLIQARKSLEQEFSPDIVHDKNVISPEQIEALIDLAINSRHRTHGRAGINIIADTQREILPVIGKSIQRYIPVSAVNIRAAFFLSNSNVGPHIDGNIEPETCFSNPSVMQLLIPLAVWGRGTGGSIVFFDQRFYGYCKNQLFALPQEGAIEEWKAGRRKEFEDFTDTDVSPIAAELMSGVLANTKPIRYYGLSVQRMVAYEPGDLIAFPSSLIHCSGSHQHDQIFSKLSLLVRVHDNLQ